MSLVLILPGVNNLYLHSALALAELGVLDKIVTGLVYRPDTLESRLLERLLWPLLRERTRPELSRRLMDGLDPSYFATTPALDLLHLLARRRGHASARLLLERLVAAIDRKAARRLRDGVRAVMGWGSTTHHAFRRAEALGIKRILALASPHDAHFARVIAAEKRLHPELFADPDASVYDRFLRFDERYLRKAEQLAQLCIVNSELTARTLREAGYETPIEVIPLGIDAPPALGPRDGDGRFRFLFVGQVSPLKGAHRLLAAWERLSPPPDFELVLVGDWQLPDSYRRRLAPTVRVLGRLARDEVDAWYRKSSVLVLPTLGDGFASVMLEALSHGVPVVTTEFGGGAEILAARAGWVVPAHVDALTDTLRAIIADPQSAESRRAVAHQTAQAYSWERYRRQVQSVVARFLDA
jgi:glycosyltransferase involved in cell wall biosynthesis